MLLEMNHPRLFYPSLLFMCKGFRLQKLFIFLFLLVLSNAMILIKNNNNKKAETRCLEYQTNCWNGMNLGTQFDKNARANLAGVQRHVFWGHIHLTLFWT